MRKGAGVIAVCHNSGIRDEIKFYIVNPTLIVNMHQIFVVHTNIRRIRAAAEELNL